MNTNPADFYKTPKEKINETATYIAIKQGVSIDDECEKVKNDYLQHRGSACAEIIVSNSYDLHNTLESIRHDSIENVVCLAFSEHGVIEICRISGDQYSSTIPVQELICKTGLLKCSFYVVHNHPFVYKASPSRMDCKAIEELIAGTIECKKIGIKVEMLDFGIVTDFDYWSTMQTINNS